MRQQDGKGVHPGFAQSTMEGSVPRLICDIPHTMLASCWSFNCRRQKASEALCTIQTRLHRMMIAVGYRIVQGCEVRCILYSAGHK